MMSQFFLGEYSKQRKNKQMFPTSMAAGFKQQVFVFLLRSKGRQSIHPGRMFLLYIHLRACETSLSLSSNSDVSS